MLLLPHNKHGSGFIVSLIWTRGKWRQIRTGKGRGSLERRSRRERKRFILGKAQKCGASRRQFGTQGPSLHRTRKLGVRTQYQKLEIKYINIREKGPKFSAHTAILINQLANLTNRKSLLFICLFRT